MNFRPIYKLEGKNSKIEIFCEKINKKDTFFLFIFRNIAQQLFFNKLNN